MGKSIKKNALYNIILNISTVIFPLITAPYIARVLSPEDVGLFNFSNTYAAYFSMVALLGIPNYAIREIAKVRDDNEKTQTLFTELFSLSILTTIIVSLIYVVSIFTVGQLKENYVIFLAAGFLLYLSPLKIDWLFSGFEEFGFLTYRSIIVKVLSVACLFLFVRTANDLLWYVLISVFATMANQAWNCFAASKYGIKFQFSTNGLKKHLGATFVLFASTITTTIYTMLDTVMLGFLSDYNEVAYYNYASHISKSLVIAVTGFATVALPRMAYYIGQGKNEEINDLVNKSFSIVGFLAVPISIGVILIAPTFIPLFLGDLYVQSSLLLQILSLIVIFIGFNNITGVQCLISFGLEKMLLYSVSIGAVVNLVMNLALIPVWGALGASLSSVAAEGLVLLASLLFLLKYTSVKISVSSDFIKTILSSVSFFPIYFILKEFTEGWFLVLAFVFLGGFTYFILQALFKNTSLEILLIAVRNKIIHK